MRKHSADMIKYLRLVHDKVCADEQALQDEIDRAIQSAGAADNERAAYVDVVDINLKEVRNLKALLEVNPITDRIWTEFQTAQDAQLQQITIAAAYDARLSDMTGGNWNSLEMQRPIMASIDEARSSYLASSKAIGEVLAEALQLVRQTYAGTDRTCDGNSSNACVEARLNQAISRCISTGKQATQADKTVDYNRHLLSLLLIKKSATAITREELSGMTRAAEDMALNISDLLDELKAILTSVPAGAVLPSAPALRFEEILESLRDIPEKTLAMMLRVDALCPTYQQSPHTGDGSAIGLPGPEADGEELAENIRQVDDHADAQCLLDEAHPAQYLAGEFMELEVPEPADYLL